MSRARVGPKRVLQQLQEAQGKEASAKDEFLAAEQQLADARMEAVKWLVQAASQNADLCEHIWQHLGEKLPLSAHRGALCTSHGSANPMPGGTVQPCGQAARPAAGHGQKSFVAASASPQPGRRPLLLDSLLPRSLSRDEEQELPELEAERAFTQSVKVPESLDVLRRVMQEDQSELGASQQEKPERDSKLELGQWETRGASSPESVHVDDGFADLTPVLDGDRQRDLLATLLAKETSSADPSRPDGVSKADEVAGEEASVA